MIGYFISLLGREKDSGKRVELALQIKDVFNRIAEVILSHLHVGGVPMRVTNALAFLIAFVEVIRSGRVGIGTTIEILFEYFWLKIAI